MTNISKKIAALLVVPVVAVSMGLCVNPVSAAPSAAPNKAGSQISEGVKAIGGDGDTANTQSVKDSVMAVVNWLLFAVGVIAVIMLIWGGIKYATSAGDSNKVTAAKNTILYAIIGLAVAVLAFAIVNLVVSQLSGNVIQGPSSS